MYAIKLTNIEQDVYGDLHPDGILSEADVWAREWGDPHKPALFGSRILAEEAAERSRRMLNGSPDLEIVEVEIVEVER